jgi:hypothetical protein
MLKLQERLRAWSVGSIEEDERYAISVVAIGVAAYYGSMWLEPPAPHHSSVPLILDLVATAFYGFAAVGSICLFYARTRRLGFALSASAAWIFLGLVIACPATGHHPYGAWWIGQLVLTAGWVTLSSVAFAVSSPHSQVQLPE